MRLWRWMIASCNQEVQNYKVRLKYGGTMIDYWLSLQGNIKG